jgi:hypothetical protein
MRCRVEQLKAEQQEVRKLQEQELEDERLRLDVSPLEY